MIARSLVTVESRQKAVHAIERWTDLPLTMLACLLIPILLAPWVLDLSEAKLENLERLDYLVWGVFTSVFLAKLLIVPNRLRYIRENWFDAILVLLPMVRPLRIVRSTAALRLLMMTRVVASTGRVMTTMRELLARGSAQFVMVAGFLTVVVGGALVTAAERHEPDASIESLADGIWWAVTTVTTVGYGDTYPKSSFGRGVGIALMLIGIGLFGALTAILASFLVSQRESGPETEIRALRQEIYDLRETILLQMGRNNVEVGEQ